MKIAWLPALALVGLISATGAAFASDGMGNKDRPVARPDNLPDPLTTKQLELRKKGLDARLEGKAYGKVYKVARGQYVQLDREGERALWTVLGEFADLAHNTLPAPDRSVDNTSIWVPDFSPAYYRSLLFDEAAGASSMRNFYAEQSANRFAVYGDVTDWVTVPGNLADYDDNPDPNVWNFLEDSVNGWYAAQIAAGRTPAQINDDLRRFDVWDRYDYDGDGNFDEPDGYIDTFQSVHAGLGEEEGGAPATIWSHSWYAHYELWGIAGPSFNKAGGIQIGDSDYWVGKYTIQPEDGGLGSWLDDGMQTIGNKPGHMGAWEKFQLGWLNYEVARAGQLSVHKLGPMEYNTKQAQGVFVILPQKVVSANIADPYAGSYFYFSGSANNLQNRMFKAFTLGAGATLTAKVNYGIEEGYDYALLIASTDGGSTWQTVPTNLSSSIVEANGIDGFSGGWVDLTADLSAYAGNVMLGFQYNSDGGVNYDGFMVDNLQVTGYALDGAESDAGWAFAGFRVSNGIDSKLYSNYYVAEYRTYMGYDNGLKTGPYYFGYLNNPALQKYVDHFAYQDGLLINYWDTSQANNNTGLHPGHGLLLPVDAHYATLYRVDGARWRNRIQTYDSTFTLAPTDGIPNIHQNSVSSPVPVLPAVSVFDDRTLHYDATNPLGSVMHPNTGTQVRIRSISALDGFMQIEVRPAK